MLKDIIFKQKLKKEELLKSQYVDRTKEPFAKKWLDSNLIKVVLGPRRAGKSVFSLLLLRDHDFMTLPSFDNLNKQKYFIDIFLGKNETIKWNATTSHNWIP